MTQKKAGGLSSSRFFCLHALQPFPLEEQHIEHAYRDGCVGKVEDRPEENKMPVGAEEEIRQPRGIFFCYVNDGEIQHVDHASMQPDINIVFLQKSISVIDRYPIKSSYDIVKI